MGIHEMIGKSDEWYTPKYVFDALECRFDLDVASPMERKHVSVPADAFVTENSLVTPWYGFVWMNPPFGGRGMIAPWLKKFVEHNNGIAFTPDRTSAPWWQWMVKRVDGVLFVNGKIKMIKPDGTKGDQPGNGTTLFALGEKGVSALARAEINGLGKYLPINKTNQ